MLGNDLPKTVCPGLDVFVFTMRHSMTSSLMTSSYKWVSERDYQYKTWHNRPAVGGACLIIAVCLITEASIRREICIHGNRLGWEAAAQSDPECCESDAFTQRRPAGGSDEGLFDVTTVCVSRGRGMLWFPTPTPAPLLLPCGHLSVGTGYYSCLWVPPTLPGTFLNLKIFVLQLLSCCFKLYISPFKRIWIVLAWDWLGHHPAYLSCYNKVMCWHTLRFCHGQSWV